MEAVIAIQDAAREFGLSRDTLDRMAERGRIKKYRRDGDKRVFVDREELKAALSYRPVEPDKP